MVFRLDGVKTNWTVKVLSVGPDTYITCKIRHCNKMYNFVTFQYLLI